MNDKAIDEAIQRIALTADGHALHLFLQQSLQALCPSTDSGALQVHEGERRFAARLKRLMDEAYAKAEQGSDGRNPGQQLIVVQRQPVAYGQRRGLERRVAGYPEPEPEPATGSGST